MGPISPEVLRALFPKSMPWRIARLTESLVGMAHWWMPGVRK